MLNAYATKFYEIGKGLAFFRAALGGETVFDAQLPDNAKNILITNLQYVVQWCSEVHLSPVARYARNCLNTPVNQLTFKKAHRILEGLEERFAENLGGVYFKFVPSDKAILYSAPFQFGPKVANNFSSANYDIEEASKCLALDRYTACVMHLMRALEVALDAVGLGVGLPNAVIEARNNWGALLIKISNQITANDKASAPAWSPKRQFFVDMHAHLFTVKNAWRNPSMHLEKKYDDKETIRIYNAVKDFMEHLATHLNASGNYMP